MSFSEFKDKASIDETDAVIGTNIALHQKITGETGTVYRYKLRTDCPRWSYEDRFESTEPLEFVEGSAAVETKATSMEIRLDGELVHAEQFFQVPLLGLTSDDMDYETFREASLKKAYAAYKSQAGAHKGKWKVYAVFGVILSIFCLCLAERKKTSACLVLIRNPEPDAPDMLLEIDKKVFDGVSSEVRNARILYDGGQNFRELVEENLRTESISYKVAGEYKAAEGVRALKILE